MAIHAGRCPNCQNRTTPGVGKTAGLWICLPCKQIFDNYGNPQPPEQQSSPKVAPRTASGVRAPKPIRSLIWKSV